MGLHKDLVDYLKEHHNTEDNAIKSRNLGELFNLTNREVRIVIATLRQEKKPICSSSNGYWYSTDPEDLEKTLHRMERQVHNMNYSIAGLQRILQEVQEKNE